MRVCLAVTCHLHFWQNDRIFYVLLQSHGGGTVPSQHRKVTVEKKIFPPLLWSVNESAVHDLLFCRHQHSGSVHGYSETRSSSKTWKAHTPTLKTVKDTNTVKLTFCCKFWVYSLNITLFEWFWWYLWHEMAFKMPHEFLTASLDIRLPPTEFRTLQTFYNSF